MDVLSRIRVCRIFTESQLMDALDALGQKMLAAVSPEVLKPYMNVSVTARGLSSLAWAGAGGRWCLNKLWWWEDTQAFSSPRVPK